MNKQELLTLFALKTITREDKTAAELAKLISCNTHTVIEFIKNLEDKNYIEVFRLNGFVNKYKILIDLNFEPPCFLNLPLTRITKEYLSKIYINYKEYLTLTSKTKCMSLIECPTWLSYNKMLKSLEPYGGISELLFIESYITKDIPNTVRDDSSYLKYVFLPLKERKCKVCGATDDMLFVGTKKTYCKECSIGLKSGKIVDPTRFFKNKISCIRKSAAIRKLDFNLTVEDLITQYLKQNKVCAYSKKEFIQGDNTYMISIDRIDSSKGYIKGNFQFIQMVYNRMKGTLSHKEFLDIITIVK